MALSATSSTVTQFVYSPALVIEFTTPGYNNVTMNDSINDTPGYNNVTMNDSINGTLLDTTYKENQTLVNGTKTTLNLYERTAIYVYPGPVICMFGMVCNILNLCVLSQPELSDSPYTYLMAIAVSDLSVLTLAFAHFVTYDLAPTFVKAFYNTYIFFVIGNILFSSGVWFIVCMTIERMLFVVRPLLYHSSVKTARINIVIVVVCSCLLNIPRFLVYEVREYKNTGKYYAFGTTFQKSDAYYITSWFHAIVVTGIPLLILLVTNIILIATVHRARKQREEFKMNSNQEQQWRKDEARLTKTLISVVVVFIVCTFPSIFVEDPVSYALFSEEGITWTEYLLSPANQNLIYISNLLLFLNCSLNFILYCAFNNKFRCTIKQFFAKFPFGRKRVHMTSSSKSN